MTLDAGEGPGDRPIVGAVTGWLCSRPFAVDIISFNLNRRLKRWDRYTVRARKADDEARQWDKVANPDKVRIVVQEYEHGARLNV